MPMSMPMLMPRFPNDLPECASAGRSNTIIKIQTGISLERSKDGGIFRKYLHLKFRSAV